MPSYPNTQLHLNKMPGRPFSKFSSEIEKMGVPRYPLHIGDTYLEPCVGARIQDIHLEEFPSSHKYISPKGHPSLIKTLSEVYSTSADLIQITPGATGGLHLLAMTFLSPGDEVLILAPYWPLVAGIVRAVGAIPICVPFYDREGTVQERIEPYLSSKTVAIYYNSPNNPTGLLLSKENVEALAELCRLQQLWIFSDEVYERLLFSGTYVPIREFAPERTLSLFSFSKAYAMAGYRCGFLLMPSKSVAQMINKAVVHSFYSVSTPAQLTAERILRIGDEWLLKTKNTYYETALRCAQILNVPIPQGGTFLFFDIRNRIGQRTLDDILLACIQHQCNQDSW